MRSRSATSTLSLLVCFLFSTTAWAQGTASVRAAAEELKKTLPDSAVLVPVPNRERLYSWIKGLCRSPHRRPGTSEGHRAEAWVEARFREFGLRSVASEKSPISVWKPSRWMLSIDRRRVAVSFIPNSGFTKKNGVSARLIYVGDGALTAEEWKNVRGKIVVAEALFSYGTGKVNADSAFFLSDPTGQLGGENSMLTFPLNIFGEMAPLSFLDVYYQAQKAGAIGLAMILRDIRSPHSSLYWPYDGAPKSLPGVYVAKRHGAFVREAAKARKKAKLTLRGRVERSTMANVYGVLPGQSDEILLITSHHDSPHKGATEDGTGMAQLLGQAWAWSQVPEEFRARTLVFVAASGHFHKGLGAYEFAKDHAELMNRARAVFTLEHLAAREVVLDARNRYQFTGRPQASSILASADTPLLAALWKSLENQPVLATACQPGFFDTPWTDAAGYVRWSREKSSGYPRSAGIPYASWVSAPLYLLDEADTLDKVDQEALVPTAEAVTEIVKNLMLLPPL